MTQPHCQEYNKVLPDQWPMMFQHTQFRNGHIDFNKGGYPCTSDRQNQLDNDCNFDSEIEFYQQQQWNNEDTDNQSATCQPAEYGNQGYMISSNNKQDLGRRMMYDFEQRAFYNNQTKQIEMERHIKQVPVWQKQDMIQKHLSKEKVQQVLYSSDLMEEDEEICQRCQEQNNYTFERTQMMQRLYSKYSSSQNCYYSRDVNAILMGGLTKAVIYFKDYATIDEQEEYLERYYFTHEFKNEITILTEHYKFQKDIPRLFMLPETIIVNNYHDKKRRIDYYRIAQLIEEENKLNPQRPPNVIVGDKMPLRINETAMSVNQDSEYHENGDNQQNKKDIKINHGEKDQEVFLDEISSFINRGQDPKMNKNQSETTLLEDLNSKLGEIINNSSRNYSLLGSSNQGKGEDEGLKPFDNGQLDNFLSFLNQQNHRKTNSNNGVPTAMIQNWLPKSADITRSKYSISQPVLVENNTQNLQKVLKEQDPKLSNTCKQRLEQNNLDNKSQQLFSGPIKKRIPPQLHLDDIDFNAEFAQKNTNIPVSQGVPYGLSAFSSKSTHTFSLQPQKDQLSVRSSRDQYQFKGNNLQLNLPVKTNFKGEYVDIKGKDINFQPALVQSQAILSSFQPSKSTNLQKFSFQQQQQPINSGSSSSIAVKLETKESQIITPRSPSFPGSSHSIFQKNLLVSYKHQQSAVIPLVKPPFSPRDSLLSSPKQSSIHGNQVPQNSMGSEKQLETSTRQTINKINQHNKNQPAVQISGNTNGNDSNFLSAMALSKSGWRQLNLKLKLDNLNSSKEKPLQNNKNENNTNTNLYGPLKGLISTANMNISNSNNGISKDPISQRSCSSKNIDQQTPKYNFYEIFKQQISTHQNSPIIAITPKSTTTTTTTTNITSQQNQGSNNNTANMLSLVSAQQAFQKVIQNSNVVSSKIQPEVQNKVAVASQVSSKQAINSQINNIPSAISHQKTFSQPKLTVSSVPSQQKQLIQPEQNKQPQQSQALFSKNIDPKVNTLASIQRRNPSATFIQTGSSQGTNNPGITKINPLEQQKKLLFQQQQHQPTVTRTDSNTLINSQTKLVLEKSSCVQKETMKNNNQGINTVNPMILSPVSTGSIATSQIKQVSRNSSIETSGNSNMISKKTSQLFQLPKKEIKSVFNLVQQLTSDNLQPKQQQFISDRNHKQTTSLYPTPAAATSNNQQYPSPFLNTHSTGTAVTATPGTIGLSGYNQVKVSQQSSECDNKDSAPSTIGGKSNNSSTQQQSSCGTISATNFKSHSTTNGSTFSTFSVSTQNNNTTIASFSNNPLTQNTPKTLAINIKSPGQQTNIATLQQPQSQQISHQLAKESQPQVSKQIQITHKHTKSENNVNLIEAATATNRSGQLNHQFNMPISSQSISSLLSSVNNNNNNNNNNKKPITQSFQSTQIPSSPCQQQQPLFSSPKKNITNIAPNFSPSQIPPQKYVSNASILSQAVIKTQPQSPRLNINPSEIQAKKSDRLISTNQQQMQYFPKNPSIQSPSSAANAKEIPKSINHLQVQIIPNNCIQTTVLSPTSNNGSSDRFSISKVQKNTLTGNQITTQTNQSSVGSYNNLSSHGLLKVQVEGGQKTKKKSMYY